MGKQNVHSIRILISTVLTFFFVTVFVGGCYLKQDYSGSSPLADEDISKFFSSVKKIDGQAESHYKMAIYFQKRKRHEMAIEELKNVIQRDPAMAKAYSAMGISYDKLGNHQQASYCYKLALKINSRLDYVYNNLGFSYFRQGQLDPAIDAFKNAIALNGQQKKYHNNLGLAYAKKGLFSQAFAEFVLGTDEAGAHFNMAKIYYDLARYENAKYHFSEAFKLDPSITEAQKGLNAAEASAKISNREKPYVNQKPKRITAVDTDKNEGNTFAYNLKDNENLNSADVERSKISQSTLSKGFETNYSKNSAAPAAAASYQKNDARIEISNGNGVDRMAKRVGNYLKSKGAKVTRLTNADHFNFAETKIYYQDVYLQEAYKVAKEIPGLQNMEKKDDLSLHNVHVKVLIGKDLVPYDALFHRPAETVEKPKKRYVEASNRLISLYEGLRKLQKLDFFDRLARNQ